MIDDAAPDPTPRITLWEDPDFYASMDARDMGDGALMWFFHLDVHRMTPGVLKRMLRAWTSIRRDNPGLLFTMAIQDSDALDRLRLMFGYQYLRDVPCTDGNVRKLYVHWPVAA